MEDSQKDFKSRKLRGDAPKFRGSDIEEDKKETPVITKWKEDVPEVVKSHPVELSGFQAQKELQEKPIEERKSVDTFADRVPEQSEKSEPDKEKKSFPPLPPMPVLSPIVPKPQVERSPLKVQVPEVSQEVSRREGRGTPLEKWAKIPAYVKARNKISEFVGTILRRPKPELPPMPAGVKPPEQLGPSWPIGKSTKQVLQEMKEKKTNP